MTRASVRRGSDVLLKELQQALRHPVEPAGQAATDKADVAAFVWQVEVHVG